MLNNYIITCYVCREYFLGNAFSQPYFTRLHYIHTTIIIMNTSTTPETRTTLAAPAAGTTTTRTTLTTFYLNVIWIAVRSRFNVKSGEGECDAVVAWRSDDVNTAQFVAVVVWKIGGLYDARQWRQRSATRCEAMTWIIQKWSNIQSDDNHIIR